jgi:nucleotide-binding universal stress UspA family protein
VADADAGRLNSPVALAVSMTRRLLVPLTDDEHSFPGLEHALDRFPDADVTVLNVVDPAGAGYGERSGDTADDANDPVDARTEALFEAARALADERGRTVDAVVVEGRPADTIVEVADDRGFDGIVMGSRGRSGVSRVLLGSVAGTVVQDASVPVTVVP